jgi:hypothetical protein
MCIVKVRLLFKLQTNPSAVEINLFFRIVSLCFLGCLSPWVNAHCMLLLLLYSVQSVLGFLKFINHFTICILNLLVHAYYIN